MISYIFILSSENTQKRLLCYFDNNKTDSNAFQVLFWLLSIDAIPRERTNLTSSSETKTERLFYLISNNTRKYVQSMLDYNIYLLYHNI